MTRAARPGVRALPIVGVGASAGGLEALEELLRGVPVGSGLAFVVVQHLDPTRKGLLVELLQRATPMTVAQVVDRVRVERDHVYVIPPDKDLSILGGVLHLFDPAAPRGHRLPIDRFLRSLAADREAGSIGVILSGMGSDGTLGVAAIKEQAGAVFVQSPETAKCDSMPRSAIDAGFADVVVPAGELVPKILAYLAHGHEARPGERPLPAGVAGAIEQLCGVVRDETGHDFSRYKQSTVLRRIERRMGLHAIPGIPAYVKFLRESPQEARLLFKELLIGVTSFFRDPDAWQGLRTDVLPALVDARAGAGGGVLRAWVPGCSTGEEAYSLAIVLHEVLAEARPSAALRLQVFATDLDKDAIDRARQGQYPANIAADVSTERLDRFFVETKHGYRVSQALRESVIFAPHDLLRDPPFTRLDVITCRNLFIYLTPELQHRLLRRFHYALGPEGTLFLGSAETIGAATDLFTPVDRKARTYRRRAGVPLPDPDVFPSSFHARPSARRPAGALMTPPNLQALADQLMLGRFAPAAVITNEQGDVLYVRGRTEPFLAPAAGKANWNIHAMARDGLRVALGAAFRKALRAERGAARARAHIDVNGTEVPVEVSVEPLDAPEALSGMVLIVFERAAAAVAEAPRRRGRAGNGTSTGTARVAQALKRAEEELQSSREEMASSHEELTAANEELQSANEELQSTNEELTTSKEEMQSMNEELQSVNRELQAKLDQLARAENDMRNLLDSTDIATLFLDGELRVRRFTAQMTRIIRLLPGDLARPITDLTSDLVYPDLIADARGVLATLQLKESEIETGDGRWYAVRIMPYRTHDDRIDGVVITFVDISASKQLEATLRQRPGAVSR